MSVCQTASAFPSRICDSGQFDSCSIGGSTVAVGTCTTNVIGGRPFGGVAFRLAIEISSRFDAIFFPEKPRHVLCGLHARRAAVQAVDTINPLSGVKHQNPAPETSRDAWYSASTRKCYDRSAVTVAKDNSDGKPQPFESSSDNAHHDNAYRQQAARKQLALGAANVHTAMLSLNATHMAWRSRLAWTISYRFPCIQKTQMNKSLHTDLSHSISSE